MPNDMRHRFTAGAVFQLPTGFQFSTVVPGEHRQAVQRRWRASGRLRNAVRANRPGNGPDVPRGTRSARAGFFSWDMRFSKFFKFGGSARLRGALRGVQHHRTT